MFHKSARFYDAIYAGKLKDYAAECRRLLELMQSRASQPIATVLDVACGTGGHMAILKEHFHIEGLDLDPAMLEIARRRLPDLRFHHGDMTSFDLGRTFDAVLCLFSSIGYVLTIERLNETMRRFARHTTPGGLVIVEPWLRPDQYNVGQVFATFVDEPELKIARIVRPQIDGRISIFDFEYLFGTPEGVERATERHELGLFTHDEYVAAFEAAELNVAFDENGLMGRGLYIGERAR